MFLLLLVQKIIAIMTNLLLFSDTGISLLCLLVVIICGYQNNEVTGLKTTENVRNTNLITACKNMNTVGNCHSISKEAPIFTMIVAVTSLTLLLIINLSRKKSQQETKSKILMKNLPSSSKVPKNLEHLRAIFDATSVGVVATDKNKIISYMNATAGLMCEVRPDQAVGEPVATVVKLVRGSRRSDISRLHSFGNNNFPPNYPTYILRGHNMRIHVQPIVSPLTIRGKVIGTVILLKDVTESRKIIKKLMYCASYDRLTGLPNRASFETCLQEAVNDLVEHPSKHALVFLDLDGFKRVNDTAGHAAGDELLKEISRLLQMQLRHSDFLARLAGDEFGLILFHCELIHAKSLMQVVVDNICQFKFKWEDKRLNIGASAGIVSIDNAGTKISELLKQADAACYQAKYSGKGQVCVFGD